MFDKKKVIVLALVLIFSTNYFCNIYSFPPPPNLYIIPVNYSLFSVQFIMEFNISVPPNYEYLYNIDINASVLILAVKFSILLPSNYFDYINSPCTYSSCEVQFQEKFSILLPPNYLDNIDSHILFCTYSSCEISFKKSLLFYYLQATWILLTPLYIFLINEVQFQEKFNILLPPNCLYNIDSLIHILAVKYSFNRSLVFFYLQTTWIILTPSYIF